MRWWILGGLVALVTVGASSVPWVPAAEATTVPVDRTWTLEDVETGHCVDVGFSATLEGTELRPMIAALPWRAWTDTSLAGETVASVHAGSGCEGAGELGALNAGIVVGDASCREWEFGPPSMGTTLAETTVGCGGAALRFDVGNLDPEEGMALHQEGYPWSGFGRDGCIGLVAWATIGSSEGDSGRSMIVTVPRPERFCLSDAA